MRLRTPARRYSSARDRRTLAACSQDRLKGLAAMPPQPIIDPESIDFSRPIEDIEGIRRINPQRFEMEQLTAIISLDLENKIVVGYKDVARDEFWVRGHMPDYPLMPGVLMCEAAAQLASYLIFGMGLLNEGFLGFGGMEDVRFRGPVRPGDRLVLVSKGVRLNRRQIICDCQGFVGSNMVFHGRLLGVPLTGRESSGSD